MSRNAFGPINWALGVPPMFLSDGRVDKDAHHVLLVLATRAKPDGSGAHPGLDWLARRSYMAVDAVQRALEACQSAGLISPAGDLNGTSVWVLHTGVVSHGRTALDEREERRRAANAERQRRWREKKSREASEEPAVTPPMGVTRNAPDPRYVTPLTPVTRNAPDGRDVTPLRNADNAPQGRYVTPLTPSQQQVIPGVTALGTTQGTTKEQTTHTPAARDEEFNAFWSTYPKRIAKAAARKAWDKAVKDGTDPAAILTGAVRFAQERQGEDPKFTPHPASWLNAGRWDDEPTPLRAVSNGYQPYRNPADDSIYDEDLT